MDINFALLVLLIFSSLVFCGMCITLIALVSLFLTNGDTKVALKSIGLLSGIANKAMSIKDKITKHK